MQGFRLFRSTLLGLACLTGLAVTAARADDAADRHAAAMTLLQQMHTADNMTQVASSILTQVRAALTRGDPDLQKQFDTFSPKLLSEAEAGKPDLIEQIVGVYTKTFTADELNKMADFYRTPLGQKIVATQVQTSDDILRVSREWGTKVGQRMLSEARVDLQSDKP